MDLNYLFRRHQISLFMAENAATEAVRRVHRSFADGYASRISEARGRRQLAGAGGCNG